MYDLISSSYDELYGEEQIKKILIIRDVLGIEKYDVVLDVGCGTGLSCNLGCTVVGVDCSKEMLKVSGGRISPVFGFAESLPFPSKSFDTVICVSAIHNFKCVKTSLLELVRVSRRYVAVSVMKKSGKFRLICQLIRDVFDVFKAVDDGRDMIYFCRVV